MNARLAHVEKYTQQHRLLFPHSSILLIPTRSGLPLSSWDKTATQISAISILNDTSIVPLDGSIFVHTFSNGGTIQFQKLIQRNLIVNGKGLDSVKKIVFDSAPGRGNFWRVVDAFAAPWDQSSFLVKFFMRSIVTVILLIAIVVYNIFGWKHIPDEIKELNGPELGVCVKEVPRMFVYSKTDRLVPWQAIEEFAAEGQKLGKMEVRLHKYEDSPHVS
jgi:hypothetical protein